MHLLFLYADAPISTFDKRKGIEGMQKHYLAPTDLVERYKGKITVRTLANWRSQGISPPFTKIGGRILYDLAELEEWERRRTVISTAQYGVK